MDRPVPDLSTCRRDFPALSRTVHGHPVAYLDGPGGTQVPYPVIEAMGRYLARSNANTHGAFATSRETDEAIAAARRAAADLMGADPDEVAFGANMTTLNFALAQALARSELGFGDEIVVTELDHQANVDPWLALAEQGFVVHQVRVDPETCTLDMADFERKLSGRTRVVAVGWASNAVGTVNDVRRIVSLAREVGALTVIDAVHYAPHGPMDVRELGCDFLLWSAYKVFGPHLGVLYGRREAFAALRTLKVQPQSDRPPEKIETGTLNHEGLAGLVAAMDYLAALGRPYRERYAPGVAGRRGDLLAAMHAIRAYEEGLLRRLLDGLQSMPGIRVYGPPRGHPRTPTVSFTLAGRAPREVAAYLAERGIFVWDGDFYATTLIRRLGLAERGGLVRVGLAPYNTADEVDRLLAALAELATGG